MNALGLGVVHAVAEGKKGQRYWNAFCLDKPRAGGPMAIACEVNFLQQGPDSGPGSKIGGVFITDEHGTLYVAYRGSVGGGKQGLGPGLFEKHYRGQWIEFDENGLVRDAVLVAALDSPELPKEIAQLVRQVQIIREMSG